MAGLPRHPAPHSLRSPEPPHWPHRSVSSSRDSQGLRLSLPMVIPPRGCSHKGSGWLSVRPVHHLSTRGRAADAVVSIALTDPTPIRSAQCPSAGRMRPVDLRSAARRDEEDHRRGDGVGGAAGRAGGRRTGRLRIGRSGADGKTGNQVFYEPRSQAPGARFLLSSSAAPPSARTPIVSRRSRVRRFTGSPPIEPANPGSRSDQVLIPGN